ncbi:MAG: hypothetical protein ACYC6C_09510 [Coriobacteriia bacterium]
MILENTTPVPASRKRFALAMVLLAAAFAFTAMLPSAAYAVEPTDVWQSVGVSVNDLGSGKTPTLVIIAQARPGLTPPLEAAIAIPSGSQLSWAGEVLGGDPNDDPTLQVTVEPGEAYDLVRFTLVNSPRAQLELTVPPDMLVRTESQAQLDLTWTTAGPLDAAALQVYVPADAHLQDATPTPDVRAFPGQYVVYSVETSPVVAGKSLSLAGTIVIGPDPAMQQSDEKPADENVSEPQEPAGQPASNPASGDTLRWALVALALVLLVVAAYLLFRYVKTPRK